MGVMQFLSMEYFHIICKMLSNVLFYQIPVRRQFLTAKNRFHSQPFNLVVLLIVPRE